MKAEFTTFYHRMFRLMVVAAVIVQPVCTNAAAGSGGLKSSFRVKLDRTVTGKVTAKEDGAGIPGVNVVVKGTQRGSTTNAAGEYSIEISGERPVLVFSFVGYKVTEVPVGNSSVVDASLEASEENLNEVVVTALGIKREERSLGYSIGKVDGKEFNRVAQENVLNAMGGKVAGVTVNQTGGTGSSVSMVIRGATSLSSDNQPLFVIDGVPVANTLNNVTEIGKDNRVDYGNAISGLNPDDISSVTVLKGPSAAALYGSRAGNGVVLITTKSGKGVDKMTVSITSNTVFDKPYRFLRWQTSMGPGQFSAIPADVSKNPLTNPLGSIIQEGIPAGFGAMLDKGYSAVQWNSPVGPDGKKVATPLVSHPNNVRDFVRTGVTTTNGVSVANSSQTYDYRISYANMINHGIIPNSDLFRNTLNINSSIKVAKKFRLGTNLDVSRNNSNNRPATERGTNPLQWAYNVSPHVNINDLRDYWMPGQEGLQQKVGSFASGNNPYFLAYEVNNGFVRDRIYGNIRGDWDITKDLTLMVRYGLDTYNEQRQTKIAKSYTDDKNGVYGLQNMKSFESNADFLATYKKNLADLSVSVSVGGNVRRQNGNSSYAGSKQQAGLVVPGVFTLQNILPAGLEYSSNSFKRGVNSLYAMTTLGYKDIVYLDLSARQDWSSTLPKASPYFYPSASVSVLVNEMFRLPNEINLIKLRGGYAQVGNDAGPYQLLQTLGNAGAWGDVPRLTTSGSLLNPFLKPEKATSYEGGIDVTLFRNRLSLAATAYVVDNENQIFNTAMAGSTGFTSKNINAGLLRSRGVEITLGGTPVQTANFKWEISANWTRNRTRVMELADEMPFFTFWEEAKGGAWTYRGEDVGDIYGPTIRTVQDQASPYYGYPLLERDATYGWGFYKVETAGQASKNKIGNFNPKFIMGVQNSISYKNIRLNFTLDWRNGGNFVSQTYRYGMSNGQTQLALDRLIDPGTRTGKELRDWLVANAETHIKVTGNNFPQVGYPTPDKASFPTFFGAVLPYGGVIIPGVYQNGVDDAGKPVYVENLGENINPGTIAKVKTGTQTIPYAAANPWDFIQPAVFSASYVKLREVSLSFGLPVKWSKSLKLQDASIAVYSRNIMLWTAAKVNIDPESAYQASTGAQAGTQFKQGIERYNVTPWVIPVGVKLNVTF
jgi:TonB-linked SusC/RagA family outer membrane protein